MSNKSLANMDINKKNNIDNNVDQQSLDSKKEIALIHIRYVADLLVSLSDLVDDDYYPHTKEKMLDILVTIGNEIADDEKE